MHHSAPDQHRLLVKKIFLVHSFIIFSPSRKPMLEITEAFPNKPYPFYLCFHAVFINLSALNAVLATDHGEAQDSEPQLYRIKREFICSYIGQVEY